MTPFAFLSVLALQARYASDAPPISLSPGLAESLLAILAGAVVGPLVTSIVKRFSFIDAQLGAAVNLVATLLLYLAAWWLFSGCDRAVLELYLVWALAGAGLGGAANNVWRKRLMPRDEP